MVDLQEHDLPPAVLVVDDHSPNLVAMKRLLRRTGARIVLAASGDEALEQVQKESRGFALALLDIQMPGMNGYQLAQSLNGLEQGREMPIIFLTAAYSDEFHQMEAYRVGAVDYLLKPVEEHLLLAKVEVFLELDRRRREREMLLQLLCDRGAVLEREVAERRRVEEVLRVHQATLDRMIEERTLDLARANRGLRTLSACNAILARAREGGTHPGEICRAIVGEGGYAAARLLNDQGMVAEAALAGEDGQAGERLALTIQVEGRPWGTLEIRERDGRCFDDEERALFSGLAGNLAHLLAVERESGERRRAEMALRQSEEQLRILAGHLEQVREEERRWIVQEMHDELGSSLAHVKMSLTWLQKRAMGEHPAMKERVDALLAHVEEAIGRMRGLTRTLRPPILDHCGVVDALRWQVREFERSGDTSCRLRVDSEEIELDETGRITLFRIAQEALTNISRHAKATEVTLAVGVMGDEVRLEIRDNGCGFDPALIQTRGRSFGLWGMRERARQGGGTVRIHTHPGQGVGVVVTLPLGQGSCEGNAP